MRRLVAITLALVATGMGVGALLGALSLLAADAITGFLPNVTSRIELLVAGAQVGALTGAVLAPISAWSLMRYVPIWRAIGEPALGTALGSIGASVAASLLGGSLAWSILGAPIGFLIAALRLRIVYGVRPVEPALVEPSR